MARGRGELNIQLNPQKLSTESGFELAQAMGSKPLVKIPIY